MTHQTAMQSSVGGTDEVLLAAVDETMLPDLIQGQISKLNELDASVKTALAAAKQAEDRALSASKLSAGRSLFSDKKREAIEGLQEAGMEFAGAIQSGARAQKLTFEFQTRLAEITKFLFGLGVGNIAANRAVVRELELRLSGASEQQLSELARQEVTAVVRQLKEQEDLHRKQEQMAGTLREQNLKIRYLLDRADESALGLQAEVAQRRDMVRRVDAIHKLSQVQQQEISTPRKEGRSHQTDIEALTTAYAQARTTAEVTSRNLLTWSERSESRLNEHEEQQRALADMIRSLVLTSGQQQQALEQQVVEQKAALEQLMRAFAQTRSALNFRTALLLALVATLPAFEYFLR